MSETPTATAVQAPTIYFIDDSATMREVMKIAFRKENIQVVTCPSVSAAIEQFGAVRPNAVISDVIMPDRDGYELCSYVKGHAELGKTPVILMSGVVNRTVAEKATVVGADELLRKPFQPQELVARVKKLLRVDAKAEPGNNETESAANRAPDEATSGLVSLEKMFRPPAPVALAQSVAAPAAASPARTAASPAVPATPAAGRSAAVPASPAAPAPVAPATPVAASAPAALARSAAPSSAAPAGDAQRLRLEIQRLELLVRKLQSELEAERQYCQALEAHIRTLQGCA